MTDALAAGAVDRAAPGRRALLTGAAVFAASRTNAQAALQEVAIAVSSTSFVVGGVRIGEKAGIFARNGLAPRIVVMDSGSAALTALLGGSTQFSISGPPEVLAARARKQDVVIVANLYAGLAGSVVLSKPVVAKLGVSPTAPLAERLRALDGLVIAEPSATSSLLGPIRAAAESVGAKIRFTYMAQGTMPAALENNAIQGMVASFPFAGTPILRGTGVLWVDGPGGELAAEVLPASSSVIQTTAATAKANPELIRRLQQTVIDIAAYIQADQAGARRALGAAYSQLSAAEIDLAYSAQWRNWTKPFLTEADLRQEVKLLKASVNLPGLDGLDLGAVQLARP